MKNKLENDLLMFFYLSCLSNMYKTLNVTTCPLIIKQRDIKSVMVEKKDFIISYIYI